MTRSRYQPGPATDHYHNQLGPAQDSGGGGVTVTGSQGGSVAATSIAMPGVVEDLGSGVAGVGLVVSLLGPFPITYQSSEIFNNGHALATLDAGTVVIKAWAIVGTGFDGNTSGLWIAAGNPVDGDWATIVRVQNEPPDTPFPTNSGTSGGATTERGPLQDQRTALVVSECSLIAALGTSGGASTATAGEADIYAIIATPAS